MIEKTSEIHESRSLIISTGYVSSKSQMCWRPACWCFLMRARKSCIKERERQARESVHRQADM